MNNKMKTKIVIGIVLFLVVILLIVMYTTQQNNKETQLMGITEINEGNYQEEVINSNKKVLIDFYASWCEPCVIIEPSLNEISNENNNIKIVRVDVDQNQSIANNYRIESIPTLVVIDKGVEVNRAVGAISKERIEELIK